jgi:hypothetical protein
MALPHILGALAGVSVTCFKNGLCSLPYYRKPWEHVITGIAGAYTFQYIVDMEEEVVAKIEKYYADLEAKQQ